MTTWLLLAIFLILIIALSVAVARRPEPKQPRDSLITRMWQALQPDFERFDPDRATTQTLNVLFAAMLTFAAVMIAWAAGAGIMRTAWLYAAPHTDIPVGEKCGALLGCDIWRGWASFWFVLPFELLRAIGGVLVIGCAAGLAGAMVGFIFGIPSEISATATPPAETRGEVPARGVDQRQAANAWRLSTNLTQISNWLTSAIIGVSLVEAKPALTTLTEMARVAGGWLFDYRHGSPAVLADVMIGCTVFGFIYAYLYTDLIISRLIAAVDRGLNVAVQQQQIIQAIAPVNDALVPAISRSAHAPPPPAPSEDERRAAQQYAAIRFEDLISRPGVTREDVRSWSRAMAVLDRYADAARGYTYLRERP